MYQIEKARVWNLLKIVYKFATWIRINARICLYKPTSVYMVHVNWLRWKHTFRRSNIVAMKSIGSASAAWNDSFTLFLMQCDLGIHFIKKRTQLANSKCETVRFACDQYFLQSFSVCPIFQRKSLVKNRILLCWTHIKILC